LGEWIEDRIKSQYTTKRNAVRLRNFLKENTDAIKKWPNLFIRGVVVFTDKNTDLKLDNPTVPVLKIKELINYIINTKSDNQFTDEDLGSIAKSILKA
jgi:hypothetical protein